MFALLFSIDTYALFHGFYYAHLAAARLLSSDSTCHPRFDER
jgi:hypothetical protein